MGSKFLYYRRQKLLHTNFDLHDGIAAAQAIYGSQYKPVITLKALSYFKEGNVAELYAGEERE